MHLNKIACIALVYHYILTMAMPIGCYENFTNIFYLEGLDIMLKDEQFVIKRLDISVER